MKSMRMVAILAMSAAFVCAQEESGAGSELSIEKNVSGYASMEEGQIVQGTYPTQLNGLPKADHVWVQRFYTGFLLATQFNPVNIKGNIGLEMRVSNEFPRKTSGDYGVTRRLYFYPYLTEADLMYYIGDISRPFFSVTAGYFPIKYNKNSRDLGEYLFRSGTYPQTLVTDFDFAATRLAGLNISSSPIEGLNVNLILNSNIEWTAVGDLNLSGLASFNLRDIFEIGAGACFSSIISADTKATDGDKSLGQLQPAYTYKTSNGDTAMYTFRGIKLMGQFCFNPKSFIPISVSEAIFGKEDLKMYAEAAVLGVKDYPRCLYPTVSTGIQYYTDITKRIPVMFGFNFPTFKLLDVLSLEGEWFGSLMPNDMYNGVFYNEPTPINTDLRLSNYVKDSSHKQYVQDNWKWSVYAKRTFMGHFQIMGTIASDHLRWYAQDWTKAEWEEAFRNPRQFYYRFKLAYLF